MQLDEVSAAKPLDEMNAMKDEDQDVDAVAVGRADKERHHKAAVETVRVIKYRTKQQSERLIEECVSNFKTFRGKAMKNVVQERRRAKAEAFLSGAKFDLKVIDFVEFPKDEKVYVREDEVKQEYAARMLDI